jgi:hypothetical protein
MRDGISHIGNLMETGSHLLIDFKKCIVKTTKKTDWCKLVANFNVLHNYRKSEANQTMVVFSRIV